MKDIFLHLDKLKTLYKEKSIKSPDKNKLSKKFLFSNNNTQKHNINANKYSTNYYSNNNNYNESISIARPSIINLNNCIKKIDFSHKYYLIEEGSDSEDCYNEDTKESIPSLVKVAKNIADPNKIMVLTDIKYFPKEATPGIIISGIEDWVLDKHIKYFLQEVPTVIELYKRNNYYNNYNETYLDIRSIKFFIEQKNRYAYVQLNSFSQMEAIGNFFLAPIKKLYPSYNSKKEKMEVYFAYNIFEVTKNHWYGVILRNLPTNCNDKTLYNFTEQKVENGIKYCSKPVIIDHLCCALVVCKELEYAEKLCFDLNNKEISNKLIKAHLHPQTCKIRKEENFENYECFSKNGYKYNINADESEKCIEHSKNFMEFFFPNYINAFFNNKNKKKEEENKQRGNSDKNKISNKSNKSIKESNEKEKKSNRKKDLVLASSIINLIKNNNSTNKKINENRNINSKDENNNSNKLIKSVDKSNLNTNNDREDKNNKDSKELIIKPQKSTLSSNENDKKEEISQNMIQKSLKNIPDKNKEKKDSIDINNNYNNGENKKEKGEIIEDSPIPKYNEDDIKYYTYNMGDINYYEEKEKEKEEQRRLYSKNKRNNRDNNYNHNYNNYNNYNGNYHNYKTNYKKYDLKNNSPYHHYSSNSNYKNYKKYSYENSGREREREWDRDRKNNRDSERFRERNLKDKEKDKEYSNDSKNKLLERSRDKFNDEEILNKNKDKKFNDYEYDKRNERGRNPNDRYRKYNTDNKYYDKNNKYYDNRYYERKKDSWQNKSKNNYEKREKYN